MNNLALDRIWESGYGKILDDERSSNEQKLWITEASEGIRNIPSCELLKRQFLYVPNDLYILHYFGSEITDFKYGLYREDQCTMYKRLMFPIWGFNSQVAGLGGWANDSEWKYIYSPDTLWEKERYLYIHPDDFRQALEDDYLIIVDGIFDSINLNRFGLHAASLMGSNFSQWHKQYLKMFKYIIVIPDNDNAGIFLTRALLKYRKDTIVLRQGKYHDIDDFIKSSDIKKLKELFDDLDLLQIQHKIIL